ncbi:cell wall-active antibiotics response protein LiaF [Alkalihalophilus lindianensis]|uniref:Cell wall-active antibiotics response protein LiaF n=1 Tax=Alkalihalophilus lindianensis TaxID=1630542 RepID=A0ABU3XEH4_9BACI|nr:cell wall-active antibiotics response protein LiaF [Alkalihalophilus lindianensis]MDV2686288.1 cell wall-active antibiotics response protein LiaF [Alkalihalophilus lindianensis]
MSKHKLIGIIIVIIGIWMLLNVLRFATGGLVAPLIFFFLGYYFYQNKRKVIAAVFFIISGSILLDQLFQVNFVGLLLAILCFYYGWKLVRGSKKSKKRSIKEREKRLAALKGEEKLRYATAKEEKDIEEPINTTVSLVDVSSHAEDDIGYEPIIRKNFLGDIHYMDKQFELRDVTIWSGLGTVKMDLSKAIIPEGESIIIIQGVIGEINVYVPDDLAVAVQASSLAGEMTIFHEKHSGINQQINHAPASYKQSKRRVKLVLSMVLGEVTVRKI